MNPESLLDLARALLADRYDTAAAKRRRRR